MAFNYSKLRGLIKEKYGTETEFANASGMDRAALSRRLNNESNFKPSDIVTMAELLEIVPEDLAIYFFNKSV